MTKIYLINKDYPFEGDDYFFIEPEIKHWAKENEIQLILCPLHKLDKKREIPNNIKYDDFLTKEIPSENSYRLKLFLTSIFNIYFWKEILYLIRNKNIKSFKEMCMHFLIIEFYKSLLINKFKNMTGNILIYNYWFDDICYASTFAKKINPNIKIITRTHGFDLYEERRKYNYIPFKRYFFQFIDIIFPISNEGKKYLENRYGIESKIIQISRLGTIDQMFFAKSSKIGSLNIVSCSYIISVKQIDKIIDALNLLSKQNKLLQIQWTHIGDGLLRKEIEIYAKKKLDILNNVKYEFKGSLENSKVFEFYKNNQIDVFINASKSEGVPVSIMEAMSVGIPIVAPAVGGISEQVITSKTGFLLENNFKVQELSKVLENEYFFKDKSIRQNVYQHYRENFNAKDNHKKFIDVLQSLLYRDNKW